MTIASSTLRSTVYNRYWATGGGAEKYGGVIAELLSRRGPVELLTHDPFDIEWLAERLRLDLSECTTRVIDDTPRSLGDAARASDLFVNVSFMSYDPAPHERSLYVVHFPTSLDAHLSGLQRAVIRRSGWLRRTALPVSFQWGSGFHHREGGRRSTAWTDGEASLSIITDPEHPVRVKLLFGFQRPASAGPAGLVVCVGGKPVASDDLIGPPSTAERLLGRGLDFEVVSPAPDVAVDVTIRSTTFVPNEIGIEGDGRTLGVPLVGIQIGSGVTGLLARAYPAILSQPVSSRWATTYGKVVSNSAFTREWVRRRWDIDSDVLYPPVSMYERGEKEPIILHVGRFFPAALGHSKKQRELVEAFRRLADSGVSGWSLHLVGGCADEGRSYLAEVEDLARGYDVHFHVNASGSELADVLGRASIYWHASGLGLDAAREPDELEHFGISTVEAMSAGAVPVVLGVGGLVETVRHGRDGYHFRTVDGLVAMTRSLIDDPDHRASMSASAEERARCFGVAAFSDRLDAIIEELGTR